MKVTSPFHYPHDTALVASVVALLEAALAEKRANTEDPYNTTVHVKHPAVPPTECRIIESHYRQAGWADASVSYSTRSNHATLDLMWYIDTSVPYSGANP